MSGVFAPRPQASASASAAASPAAVARGTGRRSAPSIIPRRCARGRAEATARPRASLRTHPAGARLRPRGVDASLRVRGTAEASRAPARTAAAGPAQERVPIASRAGPHPWSSCAVPPAKHARTHGPTRTPPARAPGIHAGAHPLAVGNVAHGVAAARHREEEPQGGAPRRRAELPRGGRTGSSAGVRSPCAASLLAAGRCALPGATHRGGRPLDLDGDHRFFAQGATGVGLETAPCRAARVLCGLAPLLGSPPQALHDAPNRVEMTSCFFCRSTCGLRAVARIFPRPPHLLGVHAQRLGVGPVTLGSDS